MNGFRSGGGFRFTNLPTTLALQQKTSSRVVGNNNNSHDAAVYSRRLDEDPDENVDNCGEQEGQNSSHGNEDETTLESLRMKDDETLDSFLSKENDKSFLCEEIDSEGHDDPDSFLSMESDVMDTTTSTTSIRGNSDTETKNPLQLPLQPNGDDDQSQTFNQTITAATTTTTMKQQHQQSQQKPSDGHQQSVGDNSEDHEEYTCLQFLQWIYQSSTNPVKEMNEYYQKMNIHPDTLKQNYKEEDVNPDEAHQPQWICTFQCPLTKQEFQSNFTNLSSIRQKLPLNVGEDDTIMIIDLLKRICGEFQINEKVGNKEEHTIIFGSKRVAKRFTVLSNLISIFTSVEGKAYFLAKMTAGRRHYPGHVKKLYRALHELGVDPSRTSIVFRERMSSTWNAKIQINALSRDAPTLLSCILIVTSPICLSVVGLPCQSKQDAVASAVALLGEKLQREQREEKKVNIDRNMGTSLSIDDDNDEHEDDRDIDNKTFRYDQIVLEHLSRCLKQAATYVYPVPTWANTPISFEKKVYLYEIAFLTENCESFVPSRMGIHPEAVTKLGIIFAEDFASRESLSGDTFQTTFELPLTNDGKSETITVSLKNRTIVHADPTKSSSLWWIQKFNQLIFSWNLYGKDYRKIPEDFDVLKETCPRDRTYLMVPLLCHSSTSASKLEINWAMLQEIATDTTTALMTPIDANWIFPFIGALDLNTIGWTFIFGALATHGPYIYMQIIGSLYKNLHFVNIDQAMWETIIGDAFVLFAMIAFCCERFVPPRRPLPTSILENRFFQQRVDERNILYVLDQNEKTGSLETAMSLCDSLDSRKTTYFDYYYKKHAIILRKPREPLFRTQLVKKHAHHDLCLRVKSQKEPVLLAPELVQVLPMPRDALYLCQHSDKFLSAIERAVEVTKFSERLRQLAYHVHAGVQCSGSQESKQMRTEGNLYIEHSLPSLVTEATTIEPCTYQRLEFLGDAVLWFFIAINLMARNSKLQFDENDLTDIGSNAVRNKTLADAALRIGISRIIESKTLRNAWRSAHRKPAPNDCSPTNKKYDMSLLEYEDHRHCEISDKALADVVESLLAVAFIEGRRCDYDRTDGCMVIGLLEELRLPLPDVDGKDLQFGWPYFRSVGKNPCLTGGYSFELDKAWQKEFVKLGTILYCESEIISRLEQNWKNLINIFDDDMGCPTELKKKLETQLSKVLVICALFDDNLDEVLDLDEDPSTDMSHVPNESSVISDGSENVEEMVNELEGLYRVAIFRDTLYYVGHHALYLYVTERIFHKFPLATAGDMHLLRTCASNDDVLCYAFCKAGLHEVLYDKDANAIVQFRYKMMLADSEGSDLWKQNGGWIYGIEEFRKRIGVADAVPRYAGLAGGRIMGHRTKVPEEFTADLTFSYKAIVGALVLSIGVDAMGACLGSIFDELFLLSPEELRSEYEDISSICESYQKGQDTA